MSLPRRAATALLSLLLMTQLVGMNALAATADETCESHGVRHNCITEEVKLETFSLPYENGLAGTKELANSKKPWETWPENWTTTGIPLRDGVKVGPLNEMKLRLFAAFNGTAQVNLTDRPLYTGIDSVRAPGPASVRALSYPIRFNATFIMSGASEFYFRSPIRWYSDDYDAHALTIRDEAGRLVVGARYHPLSQLGNTTNAMLHEDRVYYHLVARLDSLTTYTVTEYLHPRDGAGLASVDIYVANQQDVDGNGKTTFKLFPGEQAQRTYEAEGDPAFSFRFIFGQGPGGTMNLIQPNPRKNETTLEISTGAVPTRNSSAENDRYRLIIPLRTTFPLNGSVVLTICPDYATYLQSRASQSCGSNSYSARRDFSEVTGTIIEDFGDANTVVAPPVPTQTQHYARITLTITNFKSEIIEGVEQNLFSYPMFTSLLPDGAPSNHVIRRSEGDAKPEDAVVVQPIEWTMWVEVIEDYVPSPPAVNQQSPTDTLALLDPNEWLKLGVTALILAVVFPQISIPLYILATGAVILAVVTQEGSIELIGETAVKIFKGVKNFAGGLALAAVCTGAVLAPAIGAAAGGLITKTPGGVVMGARVGQSLQPLAGAACAGMALNQAGLMDDLLKLIANLPIILQKSVELVGLFLSEALRVFLAIWETFSPWIYLFLYAMSGLTGVWVLRETALIVFSWLIVLFMALKSQPAVDVLRRGEIFAKMLPIPIWDMAMKKMGAVRGTYYRDDVIKNAKGV